MLTALVAALVIAFATVTSAGPPAVQPPHDQRGAVSVAVEPVRAVYLSSGVAASGRFDYFIELLRTTDVNALVIDLKDADGRLAFRPVTEPIRALAPSRVTIRDLPRRIDAIHVAGGLAIARLAVFQDNWYAEQHPAEALQHADGRLWRDRIGYAWLDTASPVVWQYAADLAHEAATLGFDEVNFDYIRFPSDGALGSIVFPHWDGTTPKTEIVRRFAEFTDREVRQRGIRTSADLFGLSFYATDGMGIGQHLETLAPYFDVLAPMVYPSHYAKRFEGFANPADHPYEVISRTLQKGMPRLAALPDTKRPAVRPWLQDFNLGAIYDATMVQAQQRAVMERGGSGWMLWNPRGRYHTSVIGDQ